MSLANFLQDPRGVGCSESLFPSLAISITVELGKLTQVSLRITTGIYYTIFRIYRDVFSKSYRALSIESLGPSVFRRYLLLLD